MMLRPGFAYSAIAVTLSLVAGVAVRVTATEGVNGVTQLMGFAVLVVVVALVFDLPQVLAASTILVLGAVLVEAGLGDEPTWIRSLAIGCLWFITVEVGWEALERRDGSRRTAAAFARRVQELSTVVVLALVLGVVAIALISFAPARSVLLQAVILALVIGLFVHALRQVWIASTNEPR